MKIPMLVRFSLYGLLKNQRYFEPFLFLAFLEKGLSFFGIGLLVALREVAVNVLEIPSGAIADACGRRGAMILSFVAYVTCFLVLGWAERPAALALGMVLFGVGDAFRTGTHKAMIFEWLRLEGRTAERTRVYGYTRSWSKIGSAISSLLATVFVLAADGYRSIFFFAALPSALNIINFLGYPRALDGASSGARSAAEVLRRLRDALRDVVRGPSLRRLVGESMGFEGIFHAAKDYLQPVLQAMVVGALLAESQLSEKRMTALVVGPVYFVLFLVAAAASRQAHRWVTAAGSEESAARQLWVGSAVVYGGLAMAAWWQVHTVVVAAFVLLYTAQNLWRPILVSRFDASADPARGATVLSVESQAQKATTMVAAPLLGAAVDLASSHGPGGAFWPVGLLGAAVSALFIVTGCKPRHGGSEV